MSTSQTTHPDGSDENSRLQLDGLFIKFWQEQTGEEERLCLLQEALAIDPDEGATLAALAYKNDDAIDKEALLNCLQECESPAAGLALTEIYLTQNHHTPEPLRGLALFHAVARDKVNRWGPLADKATNESNWRLRRIIAMAAVEDAHHVPDYIFERLLWDTEREIREPAIEAMQKLPEAQQRRYIKDMMGSEQQEVMESVLELKVRLDGLAETVDGITKLVFHAAQSEGACAIAMFLHEHKEPDDHSWHKWILTHPHWNTRCALIGWAKDTESFHNLYLFQKAFASSDDHFQWMGFEGLLRCLTPAQATALAHSSLSHGNADVREKAIEHFRCSDKGVFDDALIGQLIGLARDGVSRVREAAIRTLAASGDPRAQPELLSSLDDVVQHVRQAAEELLNAHGDEMKRSPMGWSLWNPELDEKPWWYRLRYRIALIHHWAQRVGRELLGVPVRVHPYREGLGRTWSRKPDEPVDIEISDTPMTTGHVFGDQIMKGLILHELGHHLFDINQRGHRSMRGIARSEGLKDLHDIVIDERLERAMRSRRPRWGVYFDRLASYAFAQNIYRVPVSEYTEFAGLTEDELKAAIQAGELPGTVLPPSRSTGQVAVALRERDLLAIPGAIGVHTAFLWCLRCGFDPRHHGDPRVAQAIELIPSNLKDISQAEVLQVVRQIGALLGTGENLDQERKSLGKRFGACKSLATMLARVMDRMDQSSQLPTGARRESRAHSCRESQLPEINIVYERPQAFEDSQAMGQTLNLGKDLDIPALDSDITLPYNPEGCRALVQDIRPHVRVLRSYFERLGTTQKESFAARRGRRLDIVQARKSACISTPNLLIHTRAEIAPDLYLGLLIDRSGSMTGGKLDRAKAFAALLAESVRGLRGIEGHINAFDCTHFVQMGDFQRNGIANLETYGGNNDAGALLRAAGLAHKSHKRQKILVMISDGSPTECSVDALRQLVQRLTRQQGIICAQVAVEALPEIAFPHFVDLSAYGLDEAVSRFGRMLMKLTSHWR